jgi:hypothetical protein
VTLGRTAVLISPIAHLELANGLGDSLERRGGGLAALYPCRVKISENFSRVDDRHPC